MVAQLNLPRICTLHDVGPNYLVMEFVEGVPLKGPLPADQAMEYAVQILDALDAAHGLGITHRDLKPANILVTMQGIELLDFGLAERRSAVYVQPVPATGERRFLPPAEWNLSGGEMARNSFLSRARRSVPSISRPAGSP